MSGQYTAFTKEFKREALRFAEQPNTCRAYLARDLAIRRNNNQSCLPLLIM